MIAAVEEPCVQLGASGDQDRAVVVCVREVEPLPRIRPISAVTRLRLFVQVEPALGVS